MNKGMLIVLSGPSGSGKGTVLKKFLEENDLKFLFPQLLESLEKTRLMAWITFLSLEKNLRKWLKTMIFLNMLCLTEITMARLKSMF